MLKKQKECRWHFLLIHLITTLLSIVNKNNFLLIKYLILKV